MHEIQICSYTPGQKMLPPDQLAQATAIFYDAFRLKLHYLDLFVRSREQALRILSSCFCAENAFFALQQEHLVGFVGLEYADGRRFLQITPAILKSEFGRIGALWRMSWLQLANGYQRPRPGEMRIDSLAVGVGGRGHGTGTLLLQRAIEHARQSGCQAVTLEVVDTNPRARQLYERLGFKVRKQEWYGPITARAGLTGAAFMRKNIL